MTVTRELDAKMMIDEMMYRGEKKATYIFNGEFDTPVDLDLVNSCYSYANNIGIEIEVTWYEFNRLAIHILTPFK